MSAGSRKYPARLHPVPPPRRETGQLLAWSLMLGILLAVLLGAWTRVL